MVHADYYHYLYYSSYDHHSNDINCLVSVFYLCAFPFSFFPPFTRVYFVIGLWSLELAHK
jgi:hypothetical protein